MYVCSYVQIYMHGYAGMITWTTFNSYCIAVGGFGWHNIDGTVGKWFGMFVYIYAKQKHLGCKKVWG